MNPTTPLRGLDRRSFLRHAACLPIAAGLPGTSWWLPRGNARTLIVLELQGGNDGLNTVVPIDDGDYPRLRPTLAAVRSGAHPVGPGCALHPSLARLAGQVTAGRGAIVHGVGYEAPDRSHFRSRDIWHTADPTHDRVRADTTGWLGRAADLLAGDGAGVPAAAVGDLGLPLLLKSLRTVVPCIERADDFALRGIGGGADADALATLIEDAPTGNDAHSFAAAVAAAAVRQSAALAAGLQRYRGTVDYPDDDLGSALQLCARLAVAGFGTRLLHVGMPGFDTHAQQLPTHAGLLAALDRGVDALLQDLEAHERLADTVMLVHSEFGRRARENHSLGTDHGAAAPVLLFGGAVLPGLHGTPPDLGDLLDGDVRATTDFRAVYAALLRWLGVDASAVLGVDLATIALLAD